MGAATDDVSQPHPPKTKWRLRFSLGTLIISTALGLALLANFVQYLEIEATRQRMWHHHEEMADELHDLLERHETFNRSREEDKRQIHVSLVPTGSDDEWFWQISLPDKERYAIKIAGRNVPATGLPTFPDHTLSAEGPTWIKFQFQEQEQARAAGMPLTRWVTITSQSYRRSRVYDPRPFRNPRPNGYNLGPMFDLHLYSLTGRDARESFSADAPVELIRMRVNPPLPTDGITDPNADPPCPGFLVWIEKSKP